MCVCLCETSPVAFVIVRINWTLKDKNKDSVCVCLFVLGMGRSIFKTYDAGLLLSCRILCGAGCWWQSLSTWKERSVCSHFLIFIIILVFHAGPSRLVFHTLQTLIQSFQSQLPVGKHKKINWCCFQPINRHWCIKTENNQTGLCQIHLL